MMLPHVSEPTERGRPGSLLPVLTCLAVAVLVGAAIPAYSLAMGESLSRLLVLPAALALLFLLIFNRLLLLTLILLFRASADLVFETTRFAIGGYGIGVGGLVNAFVCLIALLIVMQHKDRINWPGVRIWLPFVGVVAAGVLYAPAPGEAVRLALAVFSYFAVFMAAYFYVRSADDLGRCFRIVLWSSVIPVLYAMVDFAMNQGATGFYGFRLKSTFTHPNIFAFYLILVIPVLLYALKSGRFELTSAMRNGLWAYMMLLVGLLLMTKTRSAWVACFAVFVLYALLFERRYLAYLTMAAVAALFIPAVQERLLDLGAASPFDPYARLNSFAWRQLIWEDGLRWMEPLRYALGYGVGAFMHYSPSFFSMSGGTQFGAHNVYVQLFFDLGLVGLAAYLALLWGLFRMTRRVAEEDRLGAFVASAVILQYAIISGSDNMLSYLAYNWYVWFIAGAAVAVVTRRARTTGREAARIGEDAVVQR
jgi:O-antigen ligase